MGPAPEQGRSRRPAPVQDSARSIVQRSATPFPNAIGNILLTPGTVLVALMWIGK